MPKIEAELNIEFPCSCMHTKMNGVSDSISFKNLDLQNGQAATAAWLGNKGPDTVLTLQLKVKPIPED